ncbi:MAG TPA: hypothetical protein VJ851_16485 [Jatrophihabitans sp.]|nr:hypothetical protein [Jatrophihabitans sp.]
MTEPTASPPAQPAKPERLTLSATQVVASGLAAVSATVAASYFGVAGTVIGAGLGSVISVVSSAIYSYSIKQTHSRVRHGLDVAVAQRFAVDPTRTVASDKRAESRLAGLRTAFNARRLALAAGGLFLLVLAATTGFELASGQPLAATVSGKQGSGTSLDGGHTSSKPTPPASSTAVRSTSSSSSATPTVTVTVSASSAPASTAPSDATSNQPSSSPTPTPTPTG